MLRVAGTASPSVFAEDFDMQRFEGEKDFPQAPAALFARLTDARFLVQCLPDVESVAEVAPDHARLVLRPSLGFMRGTLNVILQIVDLVSPTSAKLLLDSKGIGSSAKVEATLNLTPHESGSRVQWVAAITELGGLLKLVPGGLIRGAAQKVLNEVLVSAEQKLNESPA
jgi:2-furoyl-CoA dehydrogenase large subunit